MWGCVYSFAFSILLAKPGLATESCTAPNQNTAQKSFQRPQQLLEKWQNLNVV